MIYLLQTLCLGMPSQLEGAPNARVEALERLLTALNIVADNADFPHERAAALLYGQERTRQP